MNFSASCRPTSPFILAPRPVWGPAAGDRAPRSGATRSNEWVGVKKEGEQQ